MEGFFLMWYAMIYRFEWNTLFFAAAAAATAADDALVRKKVEMEGMGEENLVFFISRLFP